MTRHEIMDRQLETLIEFETSCPDAIPVHERGARLALALRQVRNNGACTPRLAVLASFAEVTS